MKGSITIPFSELFASTVRFHGVAWAHAYYTSRGMTSREFSIWYRGYRARTSK